MADLKILAEKNHEYVVKMRRHFHKYPEISTQEKETSKRICEELEAMGIEEGDTVRMYGLQFDYYK